MSKLNTLWRYIRFGLRFGADLRSRWLLASLLLRFKIVQRLTNSKFNDRIWHAAITLRDYRWAVLFRTQDIFIMYEILKGNPYIPAWLKEKNLKHILDLGAHIGLATLQFKAHFPKAIIHCYEPDPENFRLLTANTQNFNGIVLHQEAVGPVSGEGVLYIQSGRHSASSLIESTGKTTAIKCKVVTLDEILGRLGQVDLVKFDIEGIEYEVFSASKLVHQVPFIVGESKSDEQSLKRIVSCFPTHKEDIKRMAPTSLITYMFLRKQ